MPFLGLGLGLGIGRAGGAGVAGGSIFGASFDGTNDYLIKATDLIGNADSKLAIIATRIRFNGGDGVAQYLYAGSAAYPLFEKGTDNNLRLFARNAAAASILDIKSSSTITADGDYHNVIIAIDMAGTCLVYVDGSDVTAITTQTNDTIDFTRTNHAIGASVAGASKANMDCNFFYFNMVETLDISVPANYEKFFDSQGNPALNPNGNGSEATGTPPIIYHAGDIDQWHVNKGTGGGFTETGALTRPLP